jgi:hypothetical protein
VCAAVASGAVEAVRERIRKPSRLWLWSIAVACAGVSFVGIYRWLSEADFCPHTSYFVDVGASDRPVSYHDQLGSGESDLVPGSDCLVLIGLNLVAVTLAVAAEGTRFSLRGHFGLTVFCSAQALFGLFACYSVVILFARLVFSCSFSTVEHVQTVEFDQHIFHLAAAYNFVGELGYSEYRLYLFECDSLTGESCVGQLIPDYYGSRSSKARLSIDDAADQLTVFADDQLIFTVEAGSTLE